MEVEYRACAALDVYAAGEALPDAAEPAQTAPPDALADCVVAHPARRDQHGTSDVGHRAAEENHRRDGSIGSGGLEALIGPQWRDPVPRNAQVRVGHRSRRPTGRFAQLRARSA
jgi:hypothetical protein